MRGGVGIDPEIASPTSVSRQSSVHSCRCRAASIRPAASYSSTLVPVRQLFRRVEIGLVPVFQFGRAGRFELLVGLGLHQSFVRSLCTAARYLWAKGGFKQRAMKRGSRQSRTSAPETAQPKLYDYPHFSQDGKGVYVLTDHDSDMRRVAYIDLASRKLTYVPSNPQWDVEEFQLAPDGKTLAFVSNEDGISRLNIFDVASGKVRAVSGIPTGIISDPKWHNNSIDLAFNFKSPRTPNDVYSVNTANGETELWARSVTNGVDTQTTHGVLDNRHPLYSHLLLTKTEGDLENDGLLEAREIMNMNFHADLAVLSACETANGKIAPGEGVMGMSWAFFVAGTRSMLASQWKVNSASTSKLMTNFYYDLKANQSKTKKALALRQSALKLIKDQAFHHPFYWAAFVLVGSTE